MSAWFGDPWPDARNPAPVCAEPASRVPTPVGAACLHCREEVVDGDRGSLMPAVDIGPEGTPVAKIMPIHAECLLRMTVGGPAHVGGTCSCVLGGDCDPDMGMGAREAARWVWARLYRGTP